MNLFVSLGLIGGGRWLVAQPGQRGTGWALILSGVARANRAISPGSGCHRPSVQLYDRPGRRDPFGLTIGLIVACFNTAWPTYAVAHAWLLLLGCAPLRLSGFLDGLHRAEILRSEGSYLSFRHHEFQHYLSRHGQDFLMGMQCPPAPHPVPRSRSQTIRRRRGRARE